MTTSTTIGKEEEKEKENDFGGGGTKNTNIASRACSSSWWRDSRNHPHQSQWLHSTLSDLDTKIKTVLNLLEDDGDSFAKRAEMYYQKRPELIRTVQEIQGSYRSLAEKYDQLHPEPTEKSHSSNSLPISITKESDEVEINLEMSQETMKTHHELTQGPEAEFYVVVSSEKESDEKIVDLPSLEEAEKLEGSFLKISKLIDDHLKQQAKLIGRNEEKRKTIRGLCVHINKLVEENRAFKGSLARSKSVSVKQNQSSLSKMKGAILGKLRH